MSSCLADLGLDAALLPPSFVDERNALLTQRGSTHTFFPFAEDLVGWESDEPVWMLLTEEERRVLLEMGIARQPG